MKPPDRHTRYTGGSNSTAMTTTINIEIWKLWTKLNILLIFILNFSNADTLDKNNEISHTLPTIRK
jgi:hypothetical protein